MRAEYGTGILGMGHALGSRVQTNEELCQGPLRSVTPEWIEAKTGIRRRYLVAKGESASTLAHGASRAALEAAGVSPSQLGLIVVCTFSNEYLYPPASARLHRDVGASGAQTFDLQANCTGFVAGLTAASDRMLVDPSVRYALVVGLEVCSPFVDWSDQETAVYFSDGAGAAVLGRVGAGRGVLASAFSTDTANYESVRLRGGGSGFPYARGPGEAGQRSPGYMEMNGLATWKQAVTHLPATVRRACKKAGLAPEVVDLYVFHQANANLIEYTMRKMRLPVERAFMNVQEIGNAGAASIPIALSQACRSGLISNSGVVVLAGVGAGFNFGATILRWGDGPENSEPSGR